MHLLRNTPTSLDYRLRFTPRFLAWHARRRPICQHCTYAQAHKLHQWTQSDKQIRQFYNNGFSGVFNVTTILTIFCPAERAIFSFVRLGTECATLRVMGSGWFTVKMGVFTAHSVKYRGQIVTNFYDGWRCFKSHTQQISMCHFEDWEQEGPLKTCKMFC